MDLRFDHVAINVRDVPASVEWYTTTMGATVLYQDESWAFLQAGGMRIALTIRSQHPAHLAFEVGPGFPEGFLEHARRHRDGSVSRYITDPDGNAIEWIFYPDTASKGIRPDHGDSEGAEAG